MELRAYRSQDLAEVLRLFYETVHTINARDYTPAQLAVWAPEQPDMARWAKSLAAHRSFVALEEGVLAGFADLDVENAYFDRLYVSAAMQRRGVGTLLANRIEQEAACCAIEKLLVEASVTAFPFFERRGYVVLQEQQVERCGILLTNYRMEKSLD